MGGKEIEISGNIITVFDNSNYKGVTPPIKYDIKCIEGVRLQLPDNKLSDVIVKLNIFNSSISSKERRALATTRDISIYNLINNPIYPTRDISINNLINHD